MVRVSLWFHWLVAAYLWLISLVDLGSWNAQLPPHLLAAMRAGDTPGIGDAFFFIFVTLPAALFTVAILRRSAIAAIAPLGFDVVWIGLQIQSWWIPYAFGTAKPWQVKYAHGPTTKMLPSYGLHVAPDAMHVVISLLLMAALWTGIVAFHRRSFAK